MKLEMKYNEKKLKLKNEIGADLCLFHFTLSQNKMLTVATYNMETAIANVSNDPLINGQYRFIGLLKVKDLLSKIDIDTHILRIAEPTPKANFDAFKRSLLYANEKLVKNRKDKKALSLIINRLQTNAVDKKVRILQDKKGKII